jgi:hypothetical protein
MSKESLSGYQLSRIWFDWCFENPERINPNHSALYFFCIEHCNRLGWKDKFGLPTTMAKEAIGIKNYRTYINTLNDLVDFGFIKMVEKSKNQYSANIVALVQNTKALTKALDKALIKHSTKQGQSIDSIDKPIKPITINKEPPTFSEFEKYFTENGFSNIAKKVYEYYSSADWYDSKGNKVKNWKQKVQGVWFKEENKDKGTVSREVKTVY